MSYSDTECRIFTSYYSKDNGNTYYQVIFVASLMPLSGGSVSDIMALVKVKQASVFQIPRL